MSSVEQLSNLLDRVKTKQVEARMISKQRDEKFDIINKTIQNLDYRSVVESTGCLSDEQRYVLLHDISESTLEEFKEAYTILQEKIEEEVAELCERYKDI